MTTESKKLFDLYTYVNSKNYLFYYGKINGQIKLCTYFNIPFKGKIHCLLVSTSCIKTLDDLPLCTEVHFYIKKNFEIKKDSIKKDSLKITELFEIIPDIIIDTDDDISGGYFETDILAIDYISFCITNLINTLVKYTDDFYEFDILIRQMQKVFKRDKDVLVKMLPPKNNKNVFNKDDNIICNNLKIIPNFKIWGGEPYIWAHIIKRISNNLKSEMILCFSRNKKEKPRMINPKIDLIKSAIEEKNIIVVKSPYYSSYNTMYAVFSFDIENKVFALRRNQNMKLSDYELEAYFDVIRPKNNILLEFFSKNVT